MKKLIIVFLCFVICLGITGCGNSKNPYNFPDYNFENRDVLSDADDPGAIFGDVEGYGIKTASWKIGENKVTGIGGAQRLYYKTDPAFVYLFEAKIKFVKPTNDMWPKAGIVGANNSDQGISTSMLVDYNWSNNSTSGVATTYTGDGKTMNADLVTAQTASIVLDPLQVNTLTVVRQYADFFYFVNGEFVIHRNVPDFEYNDGVTGLIMWGCEVDYTDWRYSVDETEVQEMLSKAAMQVTIEPSEHGAVSSSTDLAIKGFPYTVIVQPEEGYIASSLTVNGKEVSSEIEHDDYDNSIYTLEKVTENLVFAAEFEPINDQTSVLKGYFLDYAQLSNARLYIEKSTYLQRAEIAADGSFSITVPKGENYRIVADADGCDTYISDPINLSGNVEDFEVRLSAPIFGSISGFSQKGNWDLSNSAKGTVLSPNAGGYGELFFTNLVDDADKYFLAEVSLFANNSGEFRHGILFEQYGRKEKANPTLIKSGNGYAFQIVPEDGSPFGDAIPLSSEMQSKLENDETGLKMTLIRNGAKIYVLLDEQLVYSDEVGPDDDYAVGLVSWTDAVYKNIRVVSGKEFVEDAISVHINEQTEGSGKVEIAPHPPRYRK